MNQEVVDLLQKLQAEIEELKRQGDTQASAAQHQVMELQTELKEVKELLKEVKEQLSALCGSRHRRRMLRGSSLPRVAATCLRSS